MARPKKELEVKVEKAIEEVVVETASDTQAEIEKLKKEKEETDAKFNELKAQMDLMLKQMMMNSQAPTPAFADEEVEIECFYINGATINNTEGSISYNIGYKETVNIPMSELKECFKNKINNYRELFRKGVFSFVDEKYYQVFKIKDVVDLSDETLVDILTKDGEIPYVAMTKNMGHVDFIFSNAIIYRVADLRRRGLLRDWDYRKQQEFEAHFEIKIDACINQLDLLGY